MQDIGARNDLEPNLQRITEAQTAVRVVVDSPPRAVGVDPYNKLIDRNPRDNVLEVKSP